MNQIILYRILLVIAVVAIIVLSVRLFSNKKETEIIVKEGEEEPVNSEKWVKTAPQQIVENPITLAKDGWFALATGKEDDMNAMTISWATIGHLWERPVLTVYVHPKRYTHGLMERNDYFTVTSFSEKDREKLSYLGSHSGRNEDKIKNAGLTVEYTELGNPTFTDGRLMIECRKLYSGTFDPTGFHQEKNSVFSEDDISIYTMYIGEIVNVWVKE
ncbi:flavin reductase family protein [Bacteroides helcogenes]|uniref:Flavin reductase domain protein FMN-binding protein n=1 Tax=Bacteroides helcogenes (strain ATCC 35417 / DSM 20613 / JCM 6297 / CCUG 15421 / P 36-108) TaxID=693979 RepID=E6SU11_BACT6|nr:flavin reductase [Bacteroides helcogenes]ADV43312.1 flavin reductase domain protein FMN-binding protein [Bacteroides helcogenes P 36-108]MDY5238649.1 flavin reductase [Bacteroides helcogenes]